VIDLSALIRTTWTAQQIVDAFPDDSTGEVVTTPPRPWQNPFAQRLIGSIRRECLDHVVVLGQRHLRRILTAYFAYYHRTRTNLSLEKDLPMDGLSSRHRSARSARFPKSVACILSPPAQAGCSHRPSDGSGCPRASCPHRATPAPGRRGLRPRKTEKRSKDVEMAVESGAKVSHMLSALRAGDLSPFRGGPGPRGIIVASPANHTPRSGKRRQ